MDIILKFSQIAFYFVASSLGILTYRAAKYGLLNTINTEYYKHVINRLSSLSDDIYEEFDITSDNYWVNSNSTKEFVDSMNNSIKDYKHEIITHEIDDFPHGIPVTKIELRLWSLEKKYRTDPFIPNSLRTELISLLSGRLSALQAAHQRSARYYFKLLSEGKCWENLSENEGWMHNKINEEMYKSGYGVSQVEDAVHAIRSSIQNFLSQFNPLTQTGHSLLLNAMRKFDAIRILKPRP